MSGLILVDSPVPGQTFELPEEQELSRADWLVALFGDLCGVCLEELQPLDEKEQLERVLAMGVAANIFPITYSLEELICQVKLVGMGGRLIVGHRAKRYNGSITLIRPNDRGHQDGSETLGWEALVSGVVKVLHSPGTHHTMVFEPQVNQLSNHIKEVRDFDSEP